MDWTWAERIDTFWQDQGKIQSADDAADDASSVLFKRADFVISYIINTWFILVTHLLHTNF